MKKKLADRALFTAEVNALADKYKKEPDLFKRMWIACKMMRLINWITNERIISSYQKISRLDAKNLVESVENWLFYEYYEYIAYRTKLTFLNKKWSTPSEYYNAYNKIRSLTKHNIREQDQSQYCKRQLINRSISFSGKENEILNLIWLCNKNNIDYLAWEGFIIVYGKLKSIIKTDKISILRNEINNTLQNTNE